MENTTLRSIGEDGCYDDTRAARKEYGYISAEAASPTALSARALLATLNAEQLARTVSLYDDGRCPGIIRIAVRDALVRLGNGDITLCGWRRRAAYTEHDGTDLRRHGGGIAHSRVDVLPSITRACVRRNTTGE